MQSFLGGDIVRTTDHALQELIGQTVTCQAAVSCSRSLSHHPHFTLGASGVLMVVRSLCKPMQPLGWIWTTIFFPQFPRLVSSRANNQFSLYFSNITALLVFGAVILPSPRNLIRMKYYFSIPDQLNPNLRFQQDPHNSSCAENISRRVVYSLVVYTYIPRPQWAGIMGLLQFWGQPGLHNF